MPYDLSAAYAHLRRHYAERTPIYAELHSGGAGAPVGLAASIDLRMFQRLCRAIQAEHLDMSDDRRSFEECA